MFNLSKKEATYLDFLKTYFQVILDIQKDTEQGLAKTLTDERGRKKLINELLVLRFALLNYLFFELRSPNNKDDFQETLMLINYSLFWVLDNADRQSDNEWIWKGFAEYAGPSGLKFEGLDRFETLFTDKVADKIISIANTYTRGKFDEQNNAIIELMQDIIEGDRKIFNTTVDHLKFVGSGL